MGAEDSITHLFAGIPTRNFTAALAWYERFLGRPPDRFPHAREAVWQIADGALIYVVSDADRAGRALVTVIVDDLDTWLRALADRGIEVGNVEELSRGQRKVTAVDLDGNSIAIAQVS